MTTDFLTVLRTRRPGVRGLALFVLALTLLSAASAPAAPSAAARPRAAASLAPAAVSLAPAGASLVPAAAFLPAAYLTRSYSVNLYPFGLASGHFNGVSNGDDLAALGNPFDLDNPNTEVSILLNNGDGSFRAPRNYAAGRDLYSTELVVDNFNGFGRRDIAAVNPTTGAVSVLVCNGDGTFQPARRFVTGGLPQAIATGDFNRDGKRDIAVTIQRETSGGAFSVLLGNGNGTFQPPLVSPTEPNGAQFLVATHLNGDGKIDLVMQGYQSVIAHLGMGDGTFGPLIRSAYEDIGASAAAGDVDGDGRQDLVALSPWAGTGAVLLGNGNGTFQLPRSFHVGTNPSSVALAELDGDGRLDLVMTNSETNSDDGEVIVRHGVGGGYFGASWKYPFGTPLSSIAVADYNRDGKRDIAVLDFMHFKVKVLLNNGNGTF